MTFIKALPKDNFYAVIFSSTKTDDLEGYREMDEMTMDLASKQEGYLGYESLSHENKTIFISYWESRKAIENWRLNAVHLLAKGNARKWYLRYLSQICLVENSQLFEK